MTGQGAPFLSLGADVPKVVQQAQPVAMQILTQEAQLPGLEAQNGGFCACAGGVLFTGSPLRQTGGRTRPPAPHRTRPLPLPSLPGPER